MACKGTLTPQEKYPFKTGTCHILKYFKPPALKSFNPPPHLDRFTLLRLEAKNMKLPI